MADLQNYFVVPVSYWLCSPKAQFYPVVGPFKLPQGFCLSISKILSPRTVPSYILNPWCGVLSLTGKGKDL